MSDTRKTPEAKTPWFKWPQKPVRVGPYDFRGKLFSGRLQWDGRSFGYRICGTWIDMADDESDEWRGLSQPPAPQRKKQ